MLENQPPTNRRAAGWYQDRSYPGRERYWDGANWLDVWRNADVETVKSFRTGYIGANSQGFWSALFVDQFFRSNDPDAVAKRRAMGQAHPFLIMFGGVCWLTAKLVVPAALVLTVAGFAATLIISVGSQNSDELQTVGPLVGLATAIVLMLLAFAVRKAGFAIHRRIAGHRTRLKDQAERSGKANQAQQNAQGENWLLCANQRVLSSFSSFEEGARALVSAPLRESPVLARHDQQVTHRDGYVEAYILYGGRIVCQWDDENKRLARLDPVTRQAPVNAVDAQL